MQQTIRKSNSFQNDVQRYSDFLVKMEDGPAKSEVQKLLSNLINEVKKMDELHNELIYTRQMASIGTEFREKINNIRKQLDYKLRESQSSLK